LSWVLKTLFTFTYISNEGNCSLKETWWDAITRFVVYVIHFRRLEICLLASHLEEVYAHFGWRTFLFKKLISIWKKFTFPQHPKWHKLFAKVSCIKMH
jgi:hypothetical protein